MVTRKTQKLINNAVVIALLATSYTFVRVSSTWETWNTRTMPR